MMSFVRWIGVVGLLGLLGVLALAVGMIGPAPAYGQAPNFTFTVNTTEDTVDANPGDGQCRNSQGKCSLRAAIMEANALSGTILIVLPSGTYTLTRTDPDDEKGGDLNITGNNNLTIRGAGPDQTFVDGNGRFRVFNISRGNITLEGLRVQRGNAGSDDGGGIYLFYRGTTLTLRNSTVSGNSADWGAASTTSGAP